MSALLDLATWVPILDGDPVASAMYARHYSSKKTRANRLLRGTSLFIGPGFKMVLATPCRSALFAWKRERYRRDGQTGIECTIFRNEGRARSSDLIRAADALADARFGPTRHFTFVNPGETSARRSRNSRPGECFYAAGWQFCGLTGRGLHILERAA